MIALLQRTLSASVSIDGRRIAETGAGMLALVGFGREDEEPRLDRFMERILNYRMFADAQGRMNLSLRDVDGELLLVPQFTLAADTESGNRPSFTPAAPPDKGRMLFDMLEQRIARTWPRCAFGVFGADMQVALVNDGPVTFWIEVN
ncbi:MAG: D-aminoacyl-tRNA deacylase [Candidatus Wenzhouxiangella sp. M2_3B_020]